MAIRSVANATINAITAKVIEVRNVNIPRALPIAQGRNRQLSLSRPNWSAGLRAERSGQGEQLVQPTWLERKADLMCSTMRLRRDRTPCAEDGGAAFGEPKKPNKLTARLRFACTSSAAVE